MNLKRGLIGTAIAGLLVLVAFQNCAPQGGDEFIPTNSIQMNSLAAIPISVESESITNQLVCANQNSLKIVVPKKLIDNYLCADESTLINGVQTGQICTSGVTIDPINTDNTPRACSDLILCGEAPSSFEETTSGKIRIYFDNLPWGCDAKLSVLSVKKDGSAGDLVKTFNFKVKPPSCRTCASSGGLGTCGACADAGCKVEGSDTLYNVGQTYVESCPSGQTGTGATKHCNSNFTWSLEKASSCTSAGSSGGNSSGCKVDGSNISYAVDQTYIEACPSGQTGTGATKRCTANSTWVTEQESTCSTPTNSNGSVFQCSQIATAGQFCIISNSTSEKPSSCPAGKSCAGKTAKPKDCGTGKYSVAGSSSCSACTNKPSDMTYVKSITYSTNNTSATCTYKPTCNDKGAVTTDGQSCGVKCSEVAKVGQYCSDAKKNVNPMTCPAGFYCAGGSKIPAKCGAGTYSTEGSGACGKCTNTPSDMTYVSKINYASGNTSTTCEFTSVTCKKTGKNPINDKKSCIAK